MKAFFSISVVLPTIFHNTLGAVVPVEAAMNLSKRQQTCGNPGGCPGFVLGNYYVNNCLVDSTGGVCIIGQEWVAANGTQYTDLQTPHCDPETPCTGDADTGVTNTCTWVAGNQYANCL